MADLIAFVVAARQLLDGGPLGQAAANEVPVGGLIAVVLFVLLFVLFVVAWVRKRRREGLGSREAAPEEAAEEPEEPAPPPVTPRKKKEKKEKKAPAPAPAVVEEAPAFPTFELGEARSMRVGLERTQKEGFVSRLGRLFRGKQIDESLLEQVEEVMFTSDIGVRTSQRLLQGMRDALGRKDLRDDKAVWRYLEKETKAILDGVTETSSRDEKTPEPPEVVMVIGVNGTGKTTSIGKLAARRRSRGQKVLLAAGDTFRAAAVEQLAVWAGRVGADIHRGKDSADPASVVFDAVKRGRLEGYDVVIVDTAGRLHTQVNLMEELSKVHRVIGKAHDGAPHEVLLVLDATMGQNAIQQAEMFRTAVEVTGIVLTKLDGTAKGGVVIGIGDQLRLPIRWVGVGERVQDMRPFDSGEFVAALYGQ